MGRVRQLLLLYKNLSKEVKATIWFTVCNLLQNGLHFITMPIYTRMLTPEQYGVSTLYFAWVDIVLIFTTLKLGAGVFNNGMVHYAEDRDRFQASMLGLSTTNSLLCFGVYLIFYQKVDVIFGLPHILVIAMFVYSVFSPAMTYWTARMRYEYRYIGFTIATLGFAVATSALSIFFILFSNEKGVMKIIGYVISACVINAFFYVSTLKKGKAFYNKEYWIYALKFNVPLIPHYFSMIVLSQCDRIMIANMCGESQAALYGVASNIGKIVLVFNSAITASFTPWIYEKLKKKEYNDCSKISFSLFGLIAIMVIGIMLLGPEVIRIFATEEYMPAIYVISPIAVGAYFIFVYNQVSTVEFFYGKSKYIMIASVVGAVLNMVLNYFAIGEFGFVAAAYTSVICYILFAIFHFLLMRRLCKKNDITVELFDAKKLLLLSVVMVILMIVINVLYAFDSIRYIMFAVLFVALVLKRRAIFSIIKGLKKK